MLTFHYYISGVYLFFMNLEGFLCKCVKKGFYVRQKSQSGTNVNNFRERYWTLLTKQSLTCNLNAVITQDTSENEGHVKTLWNSV